ncbi:MAG: DNA-processing protein DprA [Dysgonamonadaceae bacterium]|jgi:DNA processing protein|nr:DNA-processing protein DprA [Dysgonamonadaceae bacterium]
MNHQDLLYRISLALAKGIGYITAGQIVNTLEDLSVLFENKQQCKAEFPLIPPELIDAVHHPDVRRKAEAEIDFIAKEGITPFFIKDENYPFRLRECIDAPILLYMKGNADLNARKIVSIVGTRNATDYGREMTDILVRDIKKNSPDTLIVSGLAYGIDIQAHKSSLKNNLATVGVLAHGLDLIYPSIHRKIASEMMENGGLISDFVSETNPDRQNFLKRNRIIAGMADCTVVVESAIKGGALSTATIAGSYNRDVFAYPGKVSDTYSSGCNKLIKMNKAALITCADDLFREMGWDKEKMKEKTPVQRMLFPNLSNDEQEIIHFLRQSGQIQLNVLGMKSGFSSSRLSALLFELEMKGIIRCMPGGIYELI